jgi:hypothetical protein
VSLFKRRLSKGNGDEQEEFVLPFSATTNSWEGYWYECGLRVMWKTLQVLSFSHIIIFQLQPQKFLLWYFNKCCYFVFPAHERW